MEFVDILSLLIIVNALTINHILFNALKFWSQTPQSVLLRYLERTTWSTFCYLQRLWRSKGRAVYISVSLSTIFNFIQPKILKTFICARVSIPKVLNYFLLQVFLPLGFHLSVYHRLFIVLLLIGFTGLLCLLIWNRIREIHFEELFYVFCWYVAFYFPQQLLVLSDCLSTRKSKCELSAIYLMNGSFNLLCFCYIERSMAELWMSV